MMRFGILGPVEVLDGRHRLSLGGRRHLEVLAVLLLDPGHPVSVDRILTEVWGDAPGPGCRGVPLYPRIQPEEGVG